jgi:uncharacterized protein (UPF0210 family)
VSFVRAVTLGFDPEVGSTAARERDLPQFFEAAAAAVEAAGRSLRTRRLVLPPLNDRPKFSRQGLASILRWLEPVADASGVRWYDVPFTTFVAGDLAPTFDAALDVVRRHPRAFVNFVVADGGRIERRGVLETARFIHTVSKQSKTGYDNFRVGASCNTPEGAPFFPFTRHGGVDDAFSIALELPALVLGVLESARGSGLDALRERLVGALAAEYAAVDAIGRAIETNSGVRYRGLDGSLAPYPDATGSVAKLVELVGVDDYGSSGTMFATAYLTDVVRTAVDESGARAVGFHGVMDSLLEDPGIGERTSRGALGLDGLLSFAAVCGCGLDMVPIPGDTFVEEIASLVLDVAAMSCALAKPLGARILPIPGKQANEFTDFGHDFFFNCRVLAVRNRAVRTELFERGDFELGARKRP